MPLLDQYGNRLIAATDSGPSRGRGSGSPRNARFINNTTGMGGASDKDLGGAFYAYRMPREEAEQLYAMSWAAAKMVDIPIDDMFWRGRRFTGDDQNAIDAFEEAEHELGLMTALPERNEGWADIRHWADDRLPHRGIRRGQAGQAVHPR